MTGSADQGGPRSRRLLLAGRIGKPHGLLGEVYVTPISDDPRRFDAPGALVHADGRRLEIEGSRRHRDRLLVKFRGSDDRAQADRLRGAVYVSSEDLRELSEDEWWEHELLGLKAEDAQGSTLGTVTEVVHGPAQDLLGLDTPRGTRLVPLVAEIVVAVDVAGGRMVLEPPPGLLD